MWHQVNGRNHNIFFSGQNHLQGFHRGIAGSRYLFSWSPCSTFAPNNDVANVCITHFFFQKGKCPMGPSASAELACCGVDGRSPLLVVPAPPSAQTRGLGTKGIIQPLGAEHWHLCFTDYLKPEIFRGQQPPQPLCSFCWHPLGRTASTRTVFLKPGDPQAPRAGCYCVQGNSKSCTVEATSGVKCIYRKHPDHTEAMFKSYNIFN